MALKVCVALVAPAAMAARVSAAVALEWPTETRTPRAVAWAASSDRAGQFGRQRHQAHVALGCVEEAVEDGDVRREQMCCGLHAALGVRQKRAFEMNADGLRVACDGRLARSALQVLRRRARLHRAER